MRDELSEGFGHLWQAAAHAAGGVGATVGPKWEATRGTMPIRLGRARRAGMEATMAAFLPLMEAARAGAAGATRTAQQAGRKAGMRAGMRVGRTAPRRSNRRTMLVGFLAAGAAVGTAGALLARRRNRARWQEYESEAIGTARHATTSAMDAAQSTMDKGAQRVAGAAASTKDTANVFADQAAQAAGTAAGRTGEAVEQAKTRTDQLADQMSKNSRS
jgi:hypothetical protein